MPQSYKPFAALIKRPLGSSGWVNVKNLFKALTAVFGTFEITTDDSILISPTPKGFLIQSSVGAAASALPFAVTDNGDDTYTIAPGYVFTSSWTGTPDSLASHVPVIGSTPLNTVPAPVLANDGNPGVIVLMVTFDMLTGAAKVQPWEIQFYDAAPADIPLVRGSSGTGGVDGVYYILIWSSAGGQVVHDNITLDMLYDRLSFHG